MKILLALALLFPLFFPLCAAAQPQKKKKPAGVSKPAPKSKEVLVKIEPKTKEEILKTLDRPTTFYSENLLARVLSKITIETANGPLIPFPVADSSKDLGPSFGVMPVLALRRKADGELRSVIVPSFTYNKNLGTTATYRHYIFPDAKRYFILRASKSEKTERELMAFYYTPGLFGTGARLSVEAKHWITAKPSFYGIGIATERAARANYALNMTGEEMVLAVPLIRHVFFNLTHSFYIKRAGSGPMTDGQLSGLFPELYGEATIQRNFHNNRVALVYDDTDHPFLPKIGTYASAAVEYSNKRLGADYEYRTYSLQAKHYYNYKEEGRFVTAAHYLLQFQRGDTPPFYALPQLGESTGLRMAGDGRFTDRGKFVFTIEERITLSKSPFMKFISETEIAPFLDVGTVFAKPSDFRGRRLKYSPGIAARLVIRPQLVATIDYANGSEGSNAIIRVGYPF